MFSAGPLSRLPLSHLSGFHSEGLGLITWGLSVKPASYNSRWVYLEPEADMQAITAFATGLVQAPLPLATSLCLELVVLSMPVSSRRFDNWEVL